MPVRSIAAACAAEAARANSGIWSDMDCAAHIMEPSRKHLDQESIIKVIAYGAHDTC